MEVRVLKDLKQSTRQRFVALEFNYPSPDLEAKIICNETVNANIACRSAIAQALTDDKKIILAINGLSESLF